MKYLFCFRSGFGSLGRSVGITYGDLIGLNHTRHAFTEIFSITGGYIVRIGQVDTIVFATDLATLPTQLRTEYYVYYYTG